MVDQVNTLSDWPLMSNDNINADDLQKVITFLQGNPILTQSSNVKAFEQEWSEWLGVKYSVMVNSGTSANLVTMAVVKELKGLGEIIIPTLTWVSDVATALHLGFTPVFVDINPRTLGMDIEEVLRKITDKTRAVFITHILGFNALDQKLLDECARRGIPLIEDVCESHGATYLGKRLGSYGWISNFSFYYSHHISTIEGGMVCTNDPNVYEAARMFRSHGMVRESTSTELKERYYVAHPDLSPDFIFAFPAFNVRSSEINAVIGRSQLPRLDANNELRNRNLKRFLAGLNPNYYYTDFDQTGASSYAFSLIIRQPDEALRDRLEGTMRARKIQFRRGSVGGGNQLRQPYLKRSYPDLDPTAFPNVEHIHFFGYYIGNYPDLSLDRIDALCDLLNRIALGETIL